MGRLFGTNGVRGVVNVDLTPELAARLGAAIGSWAPAGSTVVVARDARTSGPMLEAAAVAGLLSAGVRVVRLGICPTPAAQYYVKTHPEAQAGLIVTASHNPPEFNGLKLLSERGTEAWREEEDAVEELYFAERFRAAPWDALQALEDDASANDAYGKAVQAHVDVARIRARAFTVVCDTGGGPGSLTSLPLLKALGCRVLPLFEALDGEFRGRKSEPTADNLSRLMETVHREGADLGIAHDGDADRCIFVDERGRWVPGDASLALLSRLALARRKGGVVCTPVSTSSVLEDVVRAAGGTVRWTAVGSPVVAKEMMATGAVYGGEENGGIIFPEHQYCRDGAMTAVKMLELLAQEQRPLSEWVAELPQYTVIKEKFPLASGDAATLMDELRQWVQREYPKARLDATDGLKVYLEEGWVLFRPSGTEPIVRVYAESKDERAARGLAQRFLEAGRSLVRAA